MCIYFIYTIISPKLKRPASWYRIEGMERSQIPWHPAFIEAIQLELEAYGDYLEFHPEYQLTAEPLKIDCVVIKKAKEVLITKNIAAIFRDATITLRS